jgi:hypothetical protein
MKGFKPAILLIGITLGLILFNMAFAQDTGQGLSISPLTFELTANPGDILSNKIKIYNSSNSAIIVKMETEDFKAAGETGQVVVAPEENLTYSLKRWVKIEPAEFTLEPKEQKFVDFTIEVPGNAEPGGKYGSVLATTGGVMGEGLTGAAIAQKVGALLLLTISGPVQENLTVKEFSAPPFLEYGPVPFLIRFENTGTVHVRPRGFVTITNWWGKKVADIEFPQMNVIPNAVRKVEAKWDFKWLFGKYTATLVGSYGTTNTPFDPPVLTFWIFPWKIALGIFSIILLVMLFFYLTRRRWKLAMKVLFKGEQKIENRK